MKFSPTSDEKVLAALAHASVLFSFLGPVGPTLIWVSQRNKSKYVRFHALQAMGYQAFTFWLWTIGILFIAIGVVALSVVSVALLESSSSDVFPFPFILQPLIFMSIFGVMGIFFLGGILGAVLCLMDREFKYPIISQWLVKNLQNEESTDAEREIKEDDWVSGICHATAILRFWGIITPLIIWYSQKERSAKICFQALQAAFYQLIAIVASILSFVMGMAVYLVFILGMLTIVATNGSSSTGEEISPLFSIIILVFVGGFMLFWVISVVVIPLYYLLAAIGSILTIRGRNFRYPILGGIIARRIQRPTNEEVLPI